MNQQQADIIMHDFAVEVGRVETNDQGEPFVRLKPPVILKDQGPFDRAEVSKYTEGAEILVPGRPVAVAVALERGRCVIQKALRLN